MGYFPYRTTVTSGDIVRQGDRRVDNGLGKLVNASSATYARQTGYTQQRYNTGEVVSLQTNRYVSGFSPINRPTLRISRLTNEAFSTKQIKQG